MKSNLLEQIGLTTEQALIYSCLVSTGTLQAKRLSRECKINRSLVYKILKQLMGLGLVVENTAVGSISTFSAEHPSRLNDIFNKREEELKIANHALHEVIGILGAQFNLMRKKPSILFYEGIEGIKFLNKDILLNKSDIKLIRSPLDNNTEELDERARRLLEERSFVGINTKLIVPIKNISSFISQDWDRKHLIERRRVPRIELNNPAQVVIYGNKVAITSFDNGIITTIIEDSSIAKTFDMLFDVFWNKYSN